jgi:hypothetical protein
MQRKRLKEGLEEEKHNKGKKKRITNVYER